MASQNELKSGQEGNAEHLPVTVRKQDKTQEPEFITTWLNLSSSAPPGTQLTNTAEILSCNKLQEGRTHSLKEHLKQATQSHRATTGNSHT